MLTLIGNFYFDAIDVFQIDARANIAYLLLLQNG